MGIDQLSTFKSNMFYFNLILVYLIPHAQLLICKATLRLSPVRQVIDKEVLLGAAAFTVSRERMKVATNNIPFLLSSIVFRLSTLPSRLMCSRIHLCTGSFSQHIPEKRKCATNNFECWKYFWHFNLTDGQLRYLGQGCSLQVFNTTLPCSVTCDHHLIGSSWSWYLAVFTPTVWGCIGLTMLIMGPILWMLHRTTPYYE